MVKESPEGSQHGGPHQVNLPDKMRIELHALAQFPQLIGDGRNNTLIEGGYPVGGGGGRVRLS